VGLADEIDAAAEAVVEDATLAKLAQVRRQRDRAYAENGKLAKQLEDAERLLTLHERVAAANPTPPRWLAPKRPKASHAMACGILSDCHFDEVVNPAELGGINAFDREIGRLRLERWADRFITVTRDYLSGVTWDGAVIMLGGDMFSGILHDLAETNEDTLFGSLLHWSEQLAAALDLIAGEFGRVHVPVVVGNHGRLGKVPRTKLRARDNADWLLGKMLAGQFAKDERFTFDVPDSADCTVKVYGTTHLLTHGDFVTGGVGIGGIFPPIMRGTARKREVWASQGATFDTVVMGHWHRLINAPSSGLIVNGSIKGYDEYAATRALGFERPQQAFWVVTPEHGITFTAPLIVRHPKEQW